ncbi:hypothetical protein ZWY2020_014547 [Hordeum vulgare]|nr:hypothetical protein ZWY2020_014547 [Hordeum vulgare]
MAMMAVGVTSSVIDMSMYLSPFCAALVFYELLTRSGLRDGLTGEEEERLRTCASLSCRKEDGVSKPAAAAPTQEEVPSDVSKAEGDHMRKLEEVDSVVEANDAGENVNYCAWKET